MPPSLRGHAYSWLVIAMSGQLLVPAWYAPAAVSVPLALAAPTKLDLYHRAVEDGPLLPPP